MPRVRGTVGGPPPAPRPTIRLQSSRQEVLEQTSLGDQRGGTGSRKSHTDSDFQQRCQHEAQGGKLTTGGSGPHTATPAHRAYKTRLRRTEPRNVDGETQELLKGARSPSSRGGGGQRLLRAQKLRMVQGPQVRTPAARAGLGWWPSR